MPMDIKYIWQISMQRTNQNQEIFLFMYCMTVSVYKIHGTFTCAAVV